MPLPHRLASAIWNGMLIDITEQHEAPDLVSLERIEFMANIGMAAR